MNIRVDMMSEQAHIVVSPFSSGRPTTTTTSSAASHPAATTHPTTPHTSNSTRPSVIIQTIPIWTSAEVSTHQTVTSRRGPSVRVASSRTPGTGACSGRSGRSIFSLRGQDLSLMVSRTRVWVRSKVPEHSDRDGRSRSRYGGRSWSWRGRSGVGNVRDSRIPDGIITTVQKYRVT